MVNNILRAATPVVAGVAGVLVCVLPQAPVLAGDLVYTPVNPSFGGNPFNSSHLKGLADAQNEFKEDSGGKSGSTLSLSQKFVQQLQTRLYSQLADKVSEAIFGENAQDSGRLVFEDQTITFEKTASEIKVTVYDATTGQTTEIIVPQVQSTAN